MQTAPNVVTLGAARNKPPLMLPDTLGAVIFQPPLMSPQIRGGYISATPNVTSNQGRLYIEPPLMCFGQTWSNEALNGLKSKNFEYKKLYI